MRTKRYWIEYESDEVCCGRNTHTACNASSIKSARSVIANMRKIDSKNNPRNFKVYDTWSDGEYAEVVYTES